ncbi:hypothetical protein SAMN02745166_04858, partial [Prosthecobacter debontii]
MTLSARNSQGRKSPVLSMLRASVFRRWLALLLLFLMPLSTMHQLLAVGIGQMEYDPGDGSTAYIQYEDWNGNGEFDSGELSWEYPGYDNDSDGDGIKDLREIAWGTDVYNLDSDFDGITDGDELDLLGGPNEGYHPLMWDSNSDGYSDYDQFHSFYAVNYAALGAGSSYYDWDGDGVHNPEDSNPLDSTLWDDWDGDGNNGLPYDGLGDSDGDGVYDLYDSHLTDPSVW